MELTEIGISGSKMNDRQLMNLKKDEKENQLTIMESCVPGFTSWKIFPPL